MPADDDLLGLAKSVHDHVLQSLVGVSLALAAPGTLPEPARRRAAEELAGAIARLRDLMLGAAEPAEAPATQPGGVLRSVLAEALRNARKHAGATAVSIDVREQERDLVLDVGNPYVQRDATQAPGIGLRLAAAEASRAGGRLEAGPTADGRWNLRLTLPA